MRRARVLFDRPEAIPANEEAFTIDKPRLRKRGGSWWCGNGVACETGATPPSAYDNWRRRAVRETSQ